MACKDCLLNCSEIVSDQCVQYTGPEIPLLGICTGDTLSSFEAAIAAEVVGILDGTGIEPANLTISCSFLQDIIGVSSPTLSNVLQMLITASCTLKDLVDDINIIIADNPVFNTACLTGLPSSPTRDDILQAAITLLCSVKTTVDAIPTTYVKNSDLTTLVTQVVNNINGGGGTVVQNYTKMVPYTAVAYFGPLSNFDAGGIGISTLGFSKLYICNGQNGTPDLRGRTIVGAIRSVPGGALDAAVDPAVNPNNPNWAVNDRGGETFHTLLTSEMPAHIHGVTDPGHQHYSAYRGALLPQSGNSTQCWAGATDSSKLTSVSLTGVTIQSTGGGQPHNNIQPSLSAYYIMYIP